MKPFSLLASVPDRKQRGTSPRRVPVTLGLEALEQRCLLNATLCVTPPPATTVMPTAAPAQSPAALVPASPAAATPPPSFFQAAVSLFVDGYEAGADALLLPADVPANIEANIAFNSPYVGPFAPVFLLLGAVERMAVTETFAANNAFLFLPTNPNGF